MIEPYKQGVYEIVVDSLIDGTYESCGKISKDAGFTYKSPKCPTITASSQIRLTAKSTASSFIGPCKVAMFGDGSCRDKTSDVR